MTITLVYCLEAVSTVKRSEAGKKGERQKFSLSLEFKEASVTNLLDRIVEKELYKDAPKPAHVPCQIIA